ncbi:MAG: DUF835 domain-containing protein [Methanobacteriota archaeon]|nr:MAG: DUF835 domain-containing protein [Euryarchaeota archaeon]
MVAVLWIASIIAGSICFGAGLLALLSNPRSKAALFFLFAMWAAFVALMAGAMHPLVEPRSEDVATAIGMTFVFSILLAETFLWQLTIFFPVEREVSFFPPNVYGALIIGGSAAAVALGSLARVEVSELEGVRISSLGVDLLVLYPTVMTVIAMMFIVTSRAGSTLVQRRSGTAYLIGLWIFAVSALPFVFEEEAGGPFQSGDLTLSSLWVVAGIAASGLVFAVSIARGHIVLKEPILEATLSSSKASYELLHRRVYLVEEERPDLSFEIFVDILRGRCFDCENDESFPCESLDCDACRLPCPCRECDKYTSRAQGLVVTRQYPKDIRNRLYIQTTPIVWLSTVPGKDHLDPAKLNLLTDTLVSFMERSENGAVLVDGIEYLVTSNDFPRVIKAVERWTETAMASSARLIISADPRAFDSKEMAVLEKNKEIITPERADEWRSAPR